MDKEGARQMLSHADGQTALVSLRGHEDDTKKRSATDWLKSVPL
jgi:hypothetical protein